MIWLWVVIVFLLIVLTMLILSYVQGEVHFSRAVEQDCMQLEIKAIWGVKMNRFFPMFKLMDFSKKFHSHRDWYQWLKDTLSRIECTQLNWITRVGMGDATYTAIATGAVWGMKTSSLGFIMHLVQVKSKPLIQVVPQYTHVQFTTDFNGAAGIRIIYILWAGIALVWRVMKIKGGLKTWYRVMSKTKVMTKIS